MKLLLLFMVVFGAAFSITSEGNVFDKLNIQSIFENDVERRQAFDCLMDRAPCGKYQVLKDKCPDILKTNCANCTPLQKDKYQGIMKKLELEHNAEYKEIIKKFRS